MLPDTRLVAGDTPWHVLIARLVSSGVPDEPNLVPVVLRLVRAFRLHANVGRLLRR